MGYVIVGDTAQYKGCLVSAFSENSWTREKCEKRLEQMLTAPTDNDKLLLKGHTNFRVEETESKNKWWNDPFLVN